MFRPELVSFLKLMARWPDAGNRYRSYGEDSSRLVFKMYKRYAGLFETSIGEDSTLMVRTTAEGSTLVKWMNFVPPKDMFDRIEEEDDDASE